MNKVNANHVVDRFLREEAKRNTYNMSIYEVMVLRTLASYCGEKDCRRVSQTILARDSFQSIRECQRSVYKLRQKGLLYFNESKGNDSVYMIEIRVLQFYLGLGKEKLSTPASAGRTPEKGTSAGRTPYAQQTQVNEKGTSAGRTIKLPSLNYRETTLGATQEKGEEVGRDVNRLPSILSECFSKLRAEPQATNNEAEARKKIALIEAQQHKHELGEQLDSLARARMLDKTS